MALIDEGVWVLDSPKIQKLVIFVISTPQGPHFLPIEEKFGMEEFIIGSLSRVKFGSDLLSMVALQNSKFGEICSFAPHRATDAPVSMEFAIKSTPRFHCHVLICQVLH